MPASKDSGKRKFCLLAWIEQDTLKMPSFSVDDSWRKDAKVLPLPTSLFVWLFCLLSKKTKQTDFLSDNKHPTLAFLHHLLLVLLVISCLLSFFLLVRLPHAIAIAHPPICAQIDSISSPSSENPVFHNNTHVTICYAISDYYHHFFLELIFSVDYLTFSILALIINIIDDRFVVHFSNVNSNILV